MSNPRIEEYDHSSETGAGEVYEENMRMTITQIYKHEMQCLKATDKYNRRTLLESNPIVYVESTSQ